jgi:hypothetical protein
MDGNVEEEVITYFRIKSSIAYVITNEESTVPPHNKVDGITQY